MGRSCSSVDTITTNTTHYMIQVGLTLARPWALSSILLHCQHMSCVRSLVTTICNVNNCTSLYLISLEVFQCKFNVKSATSPWWWWRSWMALTGGSTGDHTFVVLQNVNVVRHQTFLLHSMYAWPFKPNSTQSSVQCNLDRFYYDGWEKMKIIDI